MSLDLPASGCPCHPQHPTTLEPQEAVDGEMQNQEKCAEAENVRMVFTALFFLVTARFGVIMIRLLKFNLCYQ